MPSTKTEVATDENLGSLTRAELSAFEARLQESFEARLEAAVTERLSRIEVPKHDAAQDIGESIAMHTAELVNQGVGKRAPIDPKVLKNRRDTEKKMRVAIKEVVEQGDLPHYRVVAKCFLGGTLLNPEIYNPYAGPNQDMVIAWKGVPNGAMQPVNDSAIRIYDLFQKSIGYDDTMEAEPVKAGERTDRDQLDIISGGPAVSNVVEIGKEHSGEAPVFIQGSPVAKSDNRLVNKLAHMNLQ